MIFSLIAIVSGCLTPINNPADQLGGRLVVSGQVSNLIDRNEIHLGRTSADERLPVPETGAIIQLMDDNGGTLYYAEDYEIPGRYYMDGFNGVPGHTYHIEITLANGASYASRNEKMPVTVGFDQVNYSIEDEEYIDFEGTVSNQPFLKIYANAVLPSEHTNFIRWNTEECYLLSPTDFPDPFGNVPPPCFITQNADPQRVVLFDGSVYNTTQVNDLLVCSRIIDRSFHEKHYFTTYQSAMTEMAHEYWRKVNIVANQTGSIFDAPPAEIDGNIFSADNPEVKVYGYFQAVNQRYTRFYILPTDLPFNLPYKDCTFSYERSYNDYPAECLDCLSLRNSSYQRPEWF